MSGSEPRSGKADIQEYANGLQKIPPTLICGQSSVSCTSLLVPTMRTSQQGGGNQQQRLHQGGGMPRKHRTPCRRRSGGRRRWWRRARPTLWAPGSRNRGESGGSRRSGCCHGALASVAAVPSGSAPRPHACAGARLPDQRTRLSPPGTILGQTSVWMARQARWSCNSLNCACFLRHSDVCQCYNQGQNGATHLRPAMLSTRGTGTISCCNSTQKRWLTSSQH